VPDAVEVVERLVERPLLGRPGHVAPVVHHPDRVLVVEAEIAGRRGGARRAAGQEREEAAGQRGARPRGDRPRCRHRRHFLSTRAFGS
jgi:hypothetical protein